MSIDPKDIATCMTCGAREHINLMDCKPPPGHPNPENADWNHMECIACYGPSWLPLDQTDIALSINPRLRWHYNAWRIGRIVDGLKRSTRETGRAILSRLARN